MGSFVYSKGLFDSRLKLFLVVSWLCLYFCSVRGLVSVFFTFCIRGLRLLIIFFYRSWMIFLGLVRCRICF